MFQTREQALESIKSKLQNAGRIVWSADDDNDGHLTTVDCYHINGQQIALHQSFRKNYTGRKVEYQVLGWTLFLPLDSTGRAEDEARKLDSVIKEGQQEFSRQPA